MKIPANYNGPSACIKVHTYKRPSGGSMTVIELNEEDIFVDNDRKRTYKIAHELNAVFKHNGVPTHTEFNVYE